MYPLVEGIAVAQKVGCILDVQLVLLATANKKVLWKQVLLLQPKQQFAA